MRTLAVVAAAMLVTACSTTQKERAREYFNLVHPVYVTDVRVDGHRITLPEGRALVIRLPEDAATGQRWEMLPIESRTVIAPVAHDYVGKAPSPDAAQTNETGEALFRLRGVAPGTQTIVLEYRRPLEPVASKTVRFDVVVQ